MGRGHDGPWAERNEAARGEHPAEHREPRHEEERR
jgi:hypothetical protein